MNPRTSILTALLLALGALTSIPVASADLQDDLDYCQTLNTNNRPGCVAGAVYCEAIGHDFATLNECICDNYGNLGDTVAECIQNACAPPASPTACAPSGVGVPDICDLVFDAPGQQPQDCLVDFVMEAVGACAAGEPPCDADAGPLQALLDSACRPDTGSFPECYDDLVPTDPQEVLNSLCEQPGSEFPECYEGTAPGQDQIMEALNELCDGRPGEFPFCFNEGNPDPTACPPESTGDFPTCHLGDDPTPLEDLNALCDGAQAPELGFPFCFVDPEQAPGPQDFLSASPNCSNPTSGDDDNVHTLLCSVTATLDATGAFDVTYANTAQVYDDTVGDNDGRMDYAIIRVLEPNADGGFGPGSPMTITLLIDLDNGGNGYEDPADGPIVRIEAADVPVVPAPLYYDGKDLDLSTVHVQDPRKGNHVYTQISDLDNDGWTDVQELCGSEPSNPTNPLATCDDKDGDGFDLDQEEAAGTDYTNPDTDGDGLPDGSDPDPLFADKDGDGIEDGSDNCPDNANANQLDTDGDDAGNVCDEDDDDDGWTDAEEAAATPPTDPLDPNSHPDPEPVQPPFYEGIIAMVEEQVNGILENVENLDPEALAGQLQREIDNTTRAVNNATEDLSDQINDLVEMIEDEIPPAPSGIPNPLTLGTTECDDPAEITSPECQSPGPVPSDFSDPHDVDGDNNRAEPNNQVDLVELRVAYVDLDESADSTREKNGDLEGSSGATLVVWDVTKATGTELFRLHAGNSGRGGNAYPIEAFVLEQGPRNSPTQVVCVYRQGTTPFVAVNAGSYNPEALTHPCGPPVSAVAQINDAGLLVGSIWNGFMTTQPQPFLFAEDDNGDGVPENVTVNIPDPASCDPEAMTCSDYLRQVVPIGGVPDLDDLCGGSGSFPTCLVPADCAADPASCAPPPPECAEEDPANCLSDVPDLSELLGTVIPPCSPEVYAQPVFVCQNNNPGLLGKQIVVKLPTGGILQI
ncbi:MAG: hypothetical protein ACYC2H_05000 [Thermoplasmatota archaeon]